jgi:uncharacterized protein (TIGR02285 family)
MVLSKHVLAFLIVAALTTRVQAQEPVATDAVTDAHPAGKIAWVLIEFPPSFILDTALPGRGHQAGFVRYIVERMPEYEHEFEKSTIVRALGQMKQGRPVCSPSLLKTAERQTYGEFSIPEDFNLSTHIVVRKDRRERLAPYVAEGGRVNLVRLLADTSLITSITDGRTFPPLINQALAAAGDQKNIIRTGAKLQTPIQQLAAGWIDYTLNYPSELKWYLDNAGLQDQASLTYIPIEGLADFVESHVVCTKGPWGQRVIERMNAIIRDAGPRPPWYLAKLKALDPDAAALNEALLERHHPFGH